MPIFETPEPITVQLDVTAGDVRLAASDRADTTVDVLPANPDSEPDRRAAAHSRAEYVNGRLTVTTPKAKTFGLFGKLGLVDVVIALPTGSHLRGTVGAGSVRSEGRLGECALKSGAGELALERTGPLDVRTGGGGVIVGHVSGHAEVETGSGRVRLGEVEGAAVVKNSNGDTWIGQAGGDVRANTANGDIRVDRAGGDVTASTARGDLLVGGLNRGSTTLSTALGRVEVGIAEGAAANLDVQTKFGRVDNRLTTADRPEPTDQTVMVRARTSFGDIVVHRTS
jgi:hypothetical protein